MPQADQSVANASFPTVRTDINANLAALFSNNSGSTAPIVTVAHMDWIQITGASTATWYKRNSANNAWITVATISGGAISFEGTLPSQASQSGKFLTTNGTVASWASIVSGLNDAKVFTASNTWTCPVGVSKVLAVVIGGGGGGASDNSGNSGSAGGVGGYGVGFLTVIPGNTYTVTVGEGGQGGPTLPASYGLPGGTSTFSTISATGGNGGQWGFNAPAAANGSCSSVDATIRRSNVSSVIPLFAGGNGFNILRSTDNAPEPWAPDSTYTAGSRGDSTAVSFWYGAGGVGGAVILIY